MRFLPLALLGAFTYGFQARGTLPPARSDDTAVSHVVHNNLLMEFTLNSQEVISSSICPTSPSWLTSTPHAMQTKLVPRQLEGLRLSLSDLTNHKVINWTGVVDLPHDQVPSLYSYSKVTAC